MEIRLHGIGGQGIYIATQMLAETLGTEGQHVAAWSILGFQRRGGPVSGFVRSSDEPVKQRDKVYYPDCLILAEPQQMQSPAVWDGFKSKGMIVLNTSKVPEEPPHPHVKLAGVLDATTIALEELGRTALNTIMLGAFAATSKWASLDSVISILEKHFKGKMLEANKRAAKRGYHEVQHVEWEHSERDHGPPVMKSEKRSIFRTKHEGCLAEFSGTVLAFRPQARFQSPMLKREKCAHCGTCVLFCPHGIITDRGDHYAPELEWCKGCGICSQVCPACAIGLEREEV